MGCILLVFGEKVYKNSIRYHWFVFTSFKDIHYDPRSTHPPGGARDAPSPSGPKFLYFHAVFGKKWSISRLTPPLRGYHLLREILDPPLYMSTYIFADRSVNSNDKPVFVITIVDHP